jgi:hypothetical protein
MDDPAKTLAYLENLRTVFRDLREVMEKDGPMLREIAKEIDRPLPHDPDFMATEAAWVQQIATHAIVRLSEKVGVEPIGVYRDRPVRRNRKAPRR